MNLETESPRGTRGYSEVAEAQIEAMEAVDFLFHTRTALHFFPPSRCRVLDVGAGSGRDAAALVGLGHSVVAVEPMKAFIEAGKRLHPSVDIEWIQDSLPAVARVCGKFDLIFAQAVWMHLDGDERLRAMARISGLMNPGATFFLTLRHGPIPRGKRMHSVSGAETIMLGIEHGLELGLHEENQPSAYNRPEVSWTRLVLRRPV